ncbi:hypothetical protein [Paenibacillus sp. N3.4]|uniref:hypothetical protein n=1 Tax=Paenibacillus sp. N3.4 TaxID=2603222 RepID=UPI0011C9D393|nr:hypothetical protein [Paenibacillus sp. N3.4]TXK74620.1 hypothetical protein FU659_28840 [Paenibacillus sp. N3.4]
MDKIIEHGNLAEASLLLVSGSLSIYAKRDCFRYGTFKQVTITGESTEDALHPNRQANDCFNFRELAMTDWFRLKRLADQREIAFDQSIWDIASLIHNHALASNRKLENKVLIAEKEGQAAAYAIMAIKKPFTNVKASSQLVEWAGDPIAAAAMLVHAVKRYELDELLVNIPWYEKLLAEQLSHYPNKDLEDGFTIRIMDIERLIEQLMPYLREKNEQLIESLCIQRRGDGNFNLRIADLEAVFTSRELLSLIFDHTDDSSQSSNEMQMGLTNHFKQVLQDLFPIPFPHAAGLNYV